MQNQAIMDNTSAVQDEAQKFKHAHKIVQKDKQIRTNLAMHLRQIMGKHQVVAKNVAAASGVAATQLSVLVNDKRGISLINSLKLLWAFPLIARIDLVMSVAFPEVFLSVDDLNFLIKFLDRGRKDGQAIKDSIEKRINDRD